MFIAKFNFFNRTIFHMVKENYFVKLFKNRLLKPQKVNFIFLSFVCIKNFSIFRDTSNVNFMKLSYKLIQIFWNLGQRISNVIAWHNLKSHYLHKIVNDNWLKLANWHQTVNQKITHLLICMNDIDIIIFCCTYH